MACAFLWFSYRTLGDVCVRERGGQTLEVPTTRSHLGERVRALDEAITAPRGAQETARLWNVRVPCVERQKGVSTDKGTKLIAEPNQVKL